MRHCAACGASGLVCPWCRGRRFVRYDHPVGHPQFGQAIRCHVCCEGNNVNPETEWRAIQTHLSALLDSPERL